MSTLCWWLILLLHPSYLSCLAFSMHWGKVVEGFFFYVPVSSRYCQVLKFSAACMGCRCRCRFGSNALRSRIEGRVERPAWYLLCRAGTLFKTPRRGPWKNKIKKREILGTLYTTLLPLLFIIIFLCPPLTPEGFLLKKRFFSFSFECLVCARASPVNKGKYVRCVTVVIPPPKLFDPDLFFVYRRWPLFWVGRWVHVWFFRVAREGGDCVVVISLSFFAGHCRRQLNNRLFCT